MENSKKQLLIEKLAERLFCKAKEQCDPKSFIKDKPWPYANSVDNKLEGNRRIFANPTVKSLSTEKRVNPSTLRLPIEQ
jgi:hypothetical protein